MTLKRAASGAALLTASRLIARVPDIVTLLVLARLLTPTDVGLFSVAMTVILIIEAVLQLPVALVLVNLPAVEQDNVDTAFPWHHPRSRHCRSRTGSELAYGCHFFGDPRLLELIVVLGLAGQCAAGSSAPASLFSYVISISNPTPCSWCSTSR